LKAKSKTKIPSSKNYSYLTTLKDCDEVTDKIISPPKQKILMGGITMIG
jgi:hypothetical protein